MKDHKELFDALIAGKTLIYNMTGQEVRMIDGKVEGKWGFYDPELWSIKRKPLTIWVNFNENRVTNNFYKSKVEALSLQVPGDLTYEFIEVIE